ncbi:MAG TPA: KpsF/GutQ family sugar-phosphate isomerase [Beijerinckiaceae bacterium]|nr:KpsF/GutQ family sugar-phosphate isomerase [Beijerinckiaceae bacterium]
MGLPDRKPDPSAGAVASALRTLSAERDGIAILMDAIGNGLGAPFAAAVALIAAAPGRVIVTGMGKSGHVGRKLAATLTSTGTAAYFVHPGEASHGDLGMIRPDDVIVALSWSGETGELSDLIAYAKRFRVALVAITARPDSTLGREADVCLAVPNAREACPNGLAPTTSTTMQLALGDALAIALLETRGFSASDFRVYHPGGRLGALLKQVRDVMHAGDRLPVVPLGTAMADAVVVQSEKGFGCVLVVDGTGRLAGIVTDGDLRRHMSPDLLARTVDEVMTRDPKAVAPDMLLAEALEFVETRKVAALPVVADGRPVGLVHVLDLLRAGAA